MWELRNSSEGLFQVAAKACAGISAIRAGLREIREIQNNTGEFWQGRAGESARRQGRICVEEAEQICERLQTELEKLYQISGVYTAAEKDAESAADMLKVPFVQ